MKACWNKREDIINFIREKWYNFRCRVLIPVILTVITTFANLTYRKLQNETIETHREITNAIIRGDAMGAKCAMVMHLTAQHAQSPMKGVYME